MHPQIRQGEPGDCPICGMELIPLATQEQENASLAINMSPTAMQLAHVQTAVVGEGNAVKTIAVNGKVQPDERRLFTQTAHIPGRIEQLMVNFTGEYVRQGQVMAYIYSPELVTAQQELLQAQQFQAAQPALFNAARNKLRNWKLTDRQIDALLAEGTPREKFPVLANVSGYITQKMVNPGDYLQAGEPVYEIADLSQVWVMLDVYETDLSWVNPGDTVSYRIQSLPGQTFRGSISYLAPVIDPDTRVAQARIEVDNPEQLLKPQMFVSGTIQASRAASNEALLIPRSAVLWTGKRSVVYVKNSSDQEVSFIMREVTLGPSLQDQYMVEAGLQQGEEIVVNGTFSVDAAAQLAGKPSMMQATRAPEPSVNGSVALSEELELSESAKAALFPLYQDYFALKNALAQDDLPLARKAAKHFNATLAQINGSTLEEAVQAQWEQYAPVMTGKLSSQDDLEALRLTFITVSEAMISLSQVLDPLEQTLYVLHCPMANADQGARWLSREEAIANPYYGASMLRCGSVVATIE